jgi:hypothetical protein
MLYTGIGVLNSEEDLNHLRETLCLSKTDDNASEFFMQLIDESLNSMGTQLNFFVHNVAHLNAKKKSTKVKNFRVESF